MTTENSINDDRFTDSDESTDLSGLRRAALAIRADPGDYFRGLPTPTFPQPDNILFFTRTMPLNEISKAYHHRCLLVVPLMGSGAVIADENTTYLKPGLTTLILPYQYHHYANFAPEPVFWLFATFEVDQPQHLAPLRGSALPLHPAQANSLLVATQAYAALKGKRAAAPTINLALALTLASLLTHAGSQTAQRPTETTIPGSGQHLIQLVARYTHEHLHEPIRINDLARLVGLSPSHLRARFRTLAGISLGAYIQRQRFHHARNLLSNQDLQIKEIANRCGFESIYTFSRAFRHATGTSPSAYRKYPA